MKLETVKKTKVEREYFLSSTHEAVEFLEDVVGLTKKANENFVVIALTAKGEIIGWSITSIGGASEAPIYPTEILKFLLTANASIAIIAHNHPSGDSTPSEEDKTVTKRLVKCCTLVGMNLLDHIVIGHKSYTSFKAEGLL